MFLQLRCSACSWSEDCGQEAVARWLWAAGRLRRDQQPELEIMHEILKGICGELNCPECGRRGLRAAACADDGQWNTARRCAGCGQPIPAERVAALPDATLCASCQQGEESGRAAGEVEYCPRCGAVMELRLSRKAGLSRYVMQCSGNPPCRS
jgi:hypothetical protein